MRLHQGIVRKLKAEESLQIAMADWLCWNRNRLRCMVLHVPNQRMGIITRMILKAMGVKAGVSDFVFVPDRDVTDPRPLLHPQTVFLEVKVSGKKPSESQESFRTECCKHGHSYEVARSVEEMVEILTRHKLYCPTRG